MEADSAKGNEEMGPDTRGHHTLGGGLIAVALSLGSLKCRLGHEED